MGRTPNTECVICKKPLYRRPFEFKEGTEFCCKGCRSELYKRRPRPKELKLGEGWNKGLHYSMPPRSEETKRRISKAVKEYYRKHPEKALERGAKTRGLSKLSEEGRERIRQYAKARVGSKASNWKGGVTPTRRMIEGLEEYKLWRQAILERDGFRCVNCQVTHNLEVHHTTEFWKFIQLVGIKTREQAINCKRLWNIDIGITLCRDCHNNPDVRARLETLPTSIYDFEEDE